MEVHHRWMLLAVCIIQLVHKNSVWSQTHRDVTAVIGNTALLPCTVDFIGTQQVIWKDPRSNIITINEQRISGDDRFSVLRPYVREWNLQIEHVRRSDQGIYVCIINTTPARSYEVQLSIWYPPTITEHSPSLIAANIGQNITLVCNATGFPGPTIKWFKYALTGAKLEVSRDRTVYHLYNVTQEQGGTYECEADNGVSPADRRPFKIDVQFPPQVRLPYQKISQTLGRDTLLECIITANPLVTHYWEKDGRRLEDDSKYRIHLWDVGGYTKTMGAFMTDLHEEDYGQYVCVAENEFGRVQDSMFLYEWRTGDLRILDTPKDVISHRGQTVHFNCTVEGLTHTDSLTWWKHSPTTGTEKIFVTHPGSDEHVPLDPAKYEIRGLYNLYIHNVNFLDSGMYVCEVNRQTNYSAWLTVIGTAHCTSNGTVPEGQSAMLSCTLPYTGSDVDWRVDWENGERRLSSVNDDTTGLVKRYVSFPATLHDAGIYECVISSRTPPITEKCTTSLSVLPVEDGGGGVSGSVCQDTSGLVDVPMVIAIFGAGAAGLFILFICILIAVVVSFRRQLTKYKSRKQNSSSLYGTKQKPPDNYLDHSPRCGSRYRNGGVTSEKDALTSLHHYEDQTEV